MDDSTTNTNRRAFLGLALGVTGASLASGGAKGTEEPVPETGASAADRYRETRHVQAAYDRMRF